MDTEIAMGQKLDLIVLDALRSNYRHHTNAAHFARFTMDMAAAINPAALKNWTPESDSHNTVNTRLKAAVEGWLNSAGETP
jgi:hypothetical protein